MNDTVNLSAKIEQAVREQAATENGSGPLTALMIKLDEMRALGQTVEVRLDVKTNKILLVAIEQVTVDLTDLSEEESETVA